MLVPGDLGFRVAALFLFLVFPVISFVIRRKWKLAAARREEINRLLVLASEEAARAELEASLSYSSPPNYSPPTSSSTFTASTTTTTYSSNNSSSFGAVPSQRFCAVCYTPTPNRCARCKAVNYCSGKCQIIHWRQGHKDECHPPAVSLENDQANTFAGNAVKQPYPGDYVDSLVSDEIEHAEQGNIIHEKPGISSPVSSPSKLWEKDDFDASDKTLNGKTLDSLPEIHGSPDLTVAHESSSSDGMCIDGSISDDDSIHDLISDSCDSCNSLDNLETGLSNGDVKHTVLADEESYMNVEAEGEVSALDGHKEGDKTTDSLGSSISCFDKKSVEVSSSTSDFWNGSLDSSRTRNFARSSNAKAKLSGSGGGKVSDLKPSVQLSFDLSDSSSSESHSQAPQVSVEPRPLSARAVKLVVEPTLPERKSTNDGRRRSSTIISSRSPDTRVKEFTVDGDTLKSEEVRPPVGTSKDHDLPSCGSKGAHDLDRHTKDTSVSPISQKAGVSSKVSNGSSSSGTKGSSALPVKSVKGSSNGTVAPQMSSSTPSTAAGLKTSMLKVVEQLRAPKLSKYGDSTGKSNEMGIFPYDFFVKLYHWNKIEFRPFGLINCGNSCYANVVLQCLAFTPPLAAYFLQGFHSKACAKKEWCFTCEFEKLILKGKEGGSPLSPIGIVSQIPKIGSHLANGREEDAHEFLRSAIETMQSICLQEAKKSVSSSLEEETTLMGLTFGGYLRSKIKCTRCRGKSERHERMMDLTVEIEGDIETLEDALRQFTGTESLDGENKYHCGRCKSYEKAKKKLSISEAPNVLTIALKRFQSGKFGKLNKSIRIPEILNLAPYMRGSSDKSPIYRLYGVVVHLDIMNAAFSGHYVCYVRNTQNKWYKIDDSTVKPVEPDRVLNKGAYMLFYSRLSPRAPRSIRSTIVSRDLPNKVKNPVDPSRSNGRNIPRYRNQSLDANHIRDDLANLGYIHRDETARIPHIFEFDSSSDSSSLFSHSDEVSSSTDSNRESISADDFSDYIFGYNGLWRHSLDSDASSSSSSSSSSPVYSKHSPLSNAERYASTSCEPHSLQSGHAQAVPIGHPSWANIPLETCRAEDSGSGAGVSFLQSNSSSMQSRKLVNISSCRGTDSERLGWANPLDNVNSGVRLRRSSRKKAD